MRDLKPAEPGMLISQPSQVGMEEALELADWLDANYPSTAFAPKHRRIAELLRALPPPAPAGRGLLAHMKAMQGMAVAYLIPETYVDRNGEHFRQPDANAADYIKQEHVNERARAFANDMLYMLDGPEQRAAEADTAQPSKVPAPAAEPFADDLEDQISDALQDSLGPDWTCRDGAQAIVRMLEGRRQ